MYHKLYQYQLDALYSHINFEIYQKMKTTSSFIVINMTIFDQSASKIWKFPHFFKSSKITSGIRTEDGRLKILLGFKLITGLYSVVYLYCLEYMFVTNFHFDSSLYDNKVNCILACLSVGTFFNLPHPFVLSNSPFLFWVQAHRSSSEKGIG